MDKIRILWVDDEIEILKPHILFLEQKGYEVETSNNGDDGLEMILNRYYDIVFLDENMPGLTGIETLERIKTRYPNLPVVMITKSEEESIMEDAIGSNIADFLIKPVKPNQILLSLKKNLENKKLFSEKTTSIYQQEFRNISMDISNNPDYSGWMDIYRNLTRWELEIGDRIFRGVMRTSDWPARVAQRIVRHVPDAWRGRPHERELRDYVVDLVRRGSSRTGAPAEPERWTSIFRRLHDLAANDHLRSLAPAEARMYVEG